MKSVVPLMTLLNKAKMRMNKIYICSPYSGDVEQNIKNAREYCRQIILQGDLPICPHIYFTQFLNDNNEEERSLAFNINKELLKSCDFIYVYGTKISKGMEIEIEEAKRFKIPVVYIEDDLKFM